MVCWGASCVNLLRPSPSSLCQPNTPPVYLAVCISGKGTYFETNWLAVLSGTRGGTGAEVVSGAWPEAHGRRSTNTELGMAGERERERRAAARAGANWLRASFRDLLAHPNLQWRAPAKTALQHDSELFSWLCYAAICKKKRHDSGSWKLRLIFLVLWVESGWEPDYVRQATLQGRSTSVRAQLLRWSRDILGGGG